jgi:hypothetical protein
MDPDISTLRLINAPTIRPYVPIKIFSLPDFEAAPLLCYLPFATYHGMSLLDFFPCPRVRPQARALPLLGVRQLVPYYALARCNQGRIDAPAAAWGGINHLDSPCNFAIETSYNTTQEQINDARTRSSNIREHWSLGSEANYNNVWSHPQRIRGVLTVHYDAVVVHRITMSKWISPYTTFAKQQEVVIELDAAGRGEVPDAWNVKYVETFEDELLVPGPFRLEFQHLAGRFPIEPYEQDFVWEDFKLQWYAARVYEFMRLRPHIQIFEE